MSASRSALTLPLLLDDAHFGRTRRPRLTLGVDLDVMILLLCGCYVVYVDKKYYAAVAGVFYKIMELLWSQFFLLSAARSVKRMGRGGFEKTRWHRRRRR
mmetsp:Transcript_29283/g.53064  ORF Transcript_29283/g.53064 Transcript_29283/m.53064 type:complete len:100 (-) Transcript_29283:92-391(-)